MCLGVGCQPNIRWVPVNRVVLQQTDHCVRSSNFWFGTTRFVNLAGFINCTVQFAQFVSALWESVVVLKRLEILSCNNRGTAWMSGSVVQRSLRDFCGQVTGQRAEHSCLKLSPGCLSKQQLQTVSSLSECRRRCRVVAKPRSLRVSQNSKVSNEIKCSCVWTTHY